MRDRRKRSVMILSNEELHERAVGEIARLEAENADLRDVLERLIHMAECNTIPGPNTLAQARTAIAKARQEEK
jgi:hypothetical protein